MLAKEIGELSCFFSEGTGVFVLLMDKRRRSHNLTFSFTNASLASFSNLGHSGPKALVCQEIDEFCCFMF